MTEKKAGSTKTRAAAKTPKGPREHPSAKKIRLAAEALGFEVWSVPGEVYHKPATLYVETKGNNVAGTVRYPAKDFDRWRIRGRHMALPTQLAFDASWADGFMGGRIMDPAGKEVELKADYSYTQKEADNYGYPPEHAEKVLQERTYRYNDGETMTVDRWKIYTFGEFTEWIDDLIDLLKVDYPKITTKRAPSKKKTEEDVMHELLNPTIDYSL